MKKAEVICAVLLTVTPSVALAQIVSVTGGQVQGAMLDHGGAIFKGIPYAAPPVGELRWREPVPAPRWLGVRDATSFGSACAQVANARVGTNDIDEDCLYLNVWTAEWPGKSRKPVMVWIPGGANTTGASSRLESDGESLARHGVVLVSLNYRLGSFGFFSHPALSRESAHHASGNQGILDQIAALKWVRDNIAKFGGDPNNVTIFGQSAGSHDVSVLMTTPLSRGLFHRAIGESGAVIESGEPESLAEAEKRGQGLASHWAVPANASADQLREVTADEILRNESDYLGNIEASFPNLGITIDGYVFPKKPAAVFAAGEEHRVSLLGGSVAKERTPGESVPADLKTAIDAAYAPLGPRAEALYAGERDPLYGSLAEQWATDTSFRCPAVTQLAWHASAGNAAYHYEFARIVPGRESQGNTHAMDVSYVFGTIGKGLVGGLPSSLPARPSAADIELSEAMQRYWTNFARTGDPNGPGLPVWPRFNPDARSYMQFTDAGPVAKEGLRRPYCDLFIENVKRQLAK